ncbi:MAG: tetratricopeptide repeat protein [Nitrospinaceae bacterium]|nr:tetratricopeptide repeat protein [Nitrospinaceae bacterium]NIR56604.1 tetratricopeptide repeat protein [Nitrospinaceae bacterium]NIS87065.1 tetratricopeptide repeat protein [Nitrospinaceae bacterium]NIT83919.1 tetratricopeptide repeat protein [Nitrospinaceae bacterium]NIU46112.1 tetratricopeptide repeat protein [Nitrospinaceae bacterium]
MSFWNLFSSGRIKECQAKVRQEPDNPQWHFELGAEYEQQGRYPEAIAAFQETLKWAPRSAEAHFNLGVLYEKSEQGREAIFHMVQAGNLFSEKNDTAHKDKARTLLKDYYRKFDFARDSRPPSTA